MKMNGTEFNLKESNELTAEAAIKQENSKR